MLVLMIIWWIRNHRFPDQVCDVSFFLESIKMQCLFRDDFDILTAVISGDKTFQLRVFSPVGISVAEEVLLTARLCKLMDRYQRQWEK